MSVAAKLKFEDGMKRLQEIVAKLENGEELCPLL